MALARDIPTWAVAQSFSQHPKMNAVIIPERIAVRNGILLFGMKSRKQAKPRAAKTNEIDQPKIFELTTAMTSDGIQPSIPTDAKDHAMILRRRCRIGIEAEIIAKAGRTNAIAA